MARNVPTELILLEIAQGLQALAKNPDLSDQIKATYSLSESEKKKLEEAQMTIAQADQFLADLAKMKAEFVGASERLAKAEEIEKSNAQTLKEISRREVDIERADNLNAVAKQINIDEAERLGKIKESLAMESEMLKSERADLEKEKIAFKKRIESVKAQTEDL